MDLINNLNSFMINIGVDYAVCGGHAIDLFVGRKTRPHKDLDVAFYWEDRDKIVQYMLNNDWLLYEPCGTAYLHKINNAENQKRLKSNIWCVTSNNTNYKFTEHEKDMYAVEFNNLEQTELDYIEILFNTRNDTDFLFVGNGDIKIKINKAVVKMDGIPCLTPELVLLYKSKAIIANTSNKSLDDIQAVSDYQLDFDNASPKLNKEQLSWLKNALITIYPNGHKWLESGVMSVYK